MHGRKHIVWIPFGDTYFFLLCKVFWGGYDHRSLTK